MATKLFFVVEDNHVSFGERDNPRVSKLTAGWPREEILPVMLLNIPDNVNLNYEPHNGTYIVTTDDVVEYFENPEDNIYLDYVTSLLPGIRHQAEAQHFANHTWTGSEWVITPETQAQLDLEAEIADLKGQLFDQQVWLFRMTIELWKVGKAKSGWVNSDVDSDILAKAQAWVAKLNRLKEIDE